MEPTGYDTILFVFADLEKVMRSVLHSVRVDHSKAEFDLEFVQPDQDSIISASDDQCVAALSSEHMILYIYFLPYLRDYLEEHGYTITPNGDGPIALHIRRRYEIAFHIKAINECHGNDGPIGPPSPYSGWLCSPVVYEITIVTPGDPDQHHASKQMLEIFINNCMVH